MLIPSLLETDMIHLPNISWVLVIEKEVRTINFLGRV